uniref:nuclear pore complex protein NUP62-like n=1 Tax=Oncorhynchus gorbuscha TaxID=8017 RepID=UPI001EAEA0B3|nr:nuclear pore complex protein NUP62-like [Oncorhynchus gorbuscha]XP_046158025.1 nuclear pore complex protein NUP62-like [Oncorhynchus gorbuscha]XP_046158033.1 nuclear pore complex protein NUP62-like [Oncorhynchus gorbuscha]XP_046158034.1 nuclear pore complex protein NUP62-like [Oncorhynchus gorbuscha]
MAFGINLGIVFLCSLFAEHSSFTWAPRDAQRVRGYGFSGSSRMEVEQRQPGGSYPQDQFRPASHTSGSVQSEATYRGTGYNTLGGFAPSSLQPAPRGSGSIPSSFTSAQTKGKRTRAKNTDIRLSGSIASGSSVTHNKHQTKASRTYGQSVTDPSALRPVSSWEVKRIQANTLRTVQPHSGSSGLVQNPDVVFNVQSRTASNLKPSTPNYGSTQNEFKFSTSRQPNQGLVQTLSRGAPSLYGQTATHTTSLTHYVQDLKQGSSFPSLAFKGPMEISARSISTPDREVPSSGSSQTSFGPGPLSSGSTEGGSATKSYKPSFSQDVMQYQSNSASRSVSTSNQYAQTSGQRIDGASTSSRGMPTSSLASRSSLFHPSSTASGNSYGAYKPGSDLGATPSQSLFTSNQGGRGSTYSQNLLAKPAQGKYGQMSAQWGSYRPSYAASSGPVSSLFSSTQAASSTFIQNAPATAQKPSVSKPVPSQRYLFNAVKSNTSSARRPTQSLLSSSYGPTQSRTSSASSINRRRFGLTIMHSIPELYGGSTIHRLKDLTR